MENTGRKRLTATQDFTDKQGKQRRKDESFEANEQEAQEYIRAGNAREEQKQQQK